MYMQFFEEMFQVMGISVGFVIRRHPVQFLARILMILTDTWFTSVPPDECRDYSMTTSFHIHSIHYSPSSYCPTQYSSSYWWLINH
jgi:hypothetical protein